MNYYIRKHEAINYPYTVFQYFNYISTRYVTVRNTKQVFQYYSKTHKASQNC